MGLAVGFWITFSATVVALAIALGAGLRGRRRLHLIAAPLALVLLAAAIVFTEQLMRRYEFPPDELTLHLVFAKSAAALALPVIGTGLWLARRPTGRRWHQLAVWIFVVATLSATATGIWVFTLAEPK